jgi:CubicO group peptidase (beta-lactamase class C family)
VQKIKASFREKVGKFTGKSLFIIPVILLISCCSALFAEEDIDHSISIKRIKEYVMKYMKSTQIPGLSIAIYKDDFFWSEGFGYLDVENNAEVNSNSIFGIASITKPMVAVAILKLAQDGKVNLNATIQEYVQYFPEKKWPVTIKQLLGHLGGFGQYELGFAEAKELKHQHLTTKEAIEIFKDWDLIDEPGTVWRYSNLGYNLLGAVIEAASGMSFEEYMTKEIWHPLGMDRTFVIDPDNIIPNRARGYILRSGLLKNAEFLDTSLVFAAGGVESTVDDLIKFCMGLDKGKILTRGEQDQMYTSMVTRDNKFTNYGMGWETAYYLGYWRISHGGVLCGTSSSLRRLPWSSFAVTVLCNLENANLYPIGDFVVAEFLDLHDFRPVSKCITDNQILLELWIAWWSGLSYQNRYNTVSTNDRNEISEAFATFKKTINNITIDSANNISTIPIEVQTIVGSYIAECLKKKHSEEKLDYYRKHNMFELFCDYINLCKEKLVYSEVRNFT